MQAAQQATPQQDPDASSALDVLNPFPHAAEPRALGDNLLVMIYLDQPSQLARDRRVITSHWQANGVLQSAQQLVDQLAANMALWLINSHQGKVTAYASDFAGPGTPHPPLAEHVMTGGTMPPNGPGEVAICLSYFSTYNIKRYRGRNYIPFDWIHAAQGASPNLLGERPLTAQMNAAMDLWNVVYKPLDHSGSWNWVLKSPSDKQFRAITDVWVDDEWDTMTSRGLRATTRVTAKT